MNTKQIFQNEWLEVIHETMEEEAGFRHLCECLAILVVDIHEALHQSISPVKRITQLLPLSELFSVYKKENLPNEVKENLVEYLFHYNKEKPEEIKYIHEASDLPQVTRENHERIITMLAPSIKILEIREKIKEEKCRLENSIAQPINEKIRINKI